MKIRKIEIILIRRDKLALEIPVDAKPGEIVGYALRRGMDRARDLVVCNIFKEATGKSGGKSKDKGPCTTTKEIRCHLFKVSLNREDFRFHDLRHTFASHFVMRRGSLKELQEILGHKSMTITLRYAHLSQEHKKKAANLLNGLTALASENTVCHKTVEGGDVPCPQK